MKIEIKTSDRKDKFITSVKVNGIDLSMVARRYRLMQEPGEIPVLVVEIPVIDADIEIPEGCVFVRQEGEQHETECGSPAGSD